MKRIGIIAPMEEEFKLIRSSFSHAKIQKIGSKDFILEDQDSIELVLVRSSIGKVAAASTASTLINVFNVDTIVLTGVAGGMHNDINIGDIVVGNEFFQHDYNLKGVMGFERFVVPQTGKKSLLADSNLVRRLETAAAKIATNDHKKHLDAFFDTETNPRLYTGRMAAGDQFINSALEKDDLLGSIPELLAVEMESAAIAQVCHEYGVAFSTVKIISDAADHLAMDDFGRFVEDVAATTTCEIVMAFIDSVR